MKSEPPADFVGIRSQGIAYNETLLHLARHSGFLPKACKPYRAKSKGKSLPSRMRGSNARSATSGRTSSSPAASATSTT
jgi:transposase